jgi:hypothetical protein
MKRMTFVPHKATFFPFCSFVGELTRIVEEIESEDIFSSKHDRGEVTEVTVVVLEQNEEDVIHLFESWGWHEKEEQKRKVKKKLQRKEGGAIF